LAQEKFCSGPYKCFKNPRVGSTQPIKKPLLFRQNFSVHIFSGEVGKRSGFQESLVGLRWPASRGRNASPPRKFPAVRIELIQ